MPDGTRIIPENFDLPVTTAGAREAMLKLAEIFGDGNAFHFFGLMHGKYSPVGEVRAVLAGRHVLDTMTRRAELTYRDARLMTGKAFGYAGNTLSNWNKLADRGRDILREEGKWTLDR